MSAFDFAARAAAGAALATLLVATPASAARMSATFVGVIVLGHDNQGLFGAQGENMIGKRVSTTYIYNTSVGQRITGDGFDYLGGGTQFNQPTPLESVSVTIDGHTETLETSVVGPFSNVQVQNVWNLDSSPNYTGDFQTNAWFDNTFKTGLAVSNSLPTKDPIPHDLETAWTGHAAPYNGWTFNLSIPDPNDTQFGFYDLRGKNTLVTVQRLDSGDGKEDGGGTPPGAVPEPTTWALMILGFGAAGAGLRRRRGLLAV